MIPRGLLYSEEALVVAWEPGLVTAEFITSIGARPTISITSTLVTRKQLGLSSSTTRSQSPTKQLALAPTSNTVTGYGASTFGTRLSRIVGRDPQTKMHTLSVCANS